MRVLLAGHMDTVFGADHPFQSARLIDGDTLNAPGAADMKGGLLVMLFALQAVERSRLADRIGYEIVINADEEIGSPGSARLMTEAARRAQFACLYEPALADGTLAGARKGSGNFSAIIRAKRSCWTRSASRAQCDRRRRRVCLAPRCAFRKAGRADGQCRED